MKKFLLFMLLVMAVPVRMWGEEEADIDDVSYELSEDSQFVASKQFDIINAKCDDSLFK